MVKKKIHRQRGIERKSEIEKERERKRKREHWLKINRLGIEEREERKSSV